MKTLLLLALLGSQTVFAEVPKYLKIKPTKGISVPVGGQSELTVEAEVEKGFHIQANPASKPNLIPTTLTLTGADGVTLGAPQYPAGKAWKLLGSPEEIQTYDGVVSIKVAVSVPADAKPGKRTVEGKLRYQACSEKTCFFPMNIPVKADVTVTKK